MRRKELEQLSSADTRIAIVGGGKMGEAIMGGWIAATSGVAAAWDASCFTAVDPGDERRDYLADTYGVACVEDASMLDHADIILLSVKPQVMPSVLPVLSSMNFTADALCISIAAGLSTEKLESQLPEGIHLVRVMPNTPLLVGKGATTLCPGSNATAEETDLVRDLFACIGDAFIVDESQMDITCAINGSGPAYIAALIEAIAQAGARAGLDADLAERLATQTAYGTASLMLERGQSAEKTRLDVCSPGGTTLAALAAMGEAGFSEAMAAGVDAAIKRSKELGA